MANMNIHDVTEIHAGSVMHSNANAISLHITNSEGTFELTLFGLPTDAADYLSSALAPSRPYRRSEDDIRADERRKIASRLGIAA